tara:strand:- start:3253 stop:3684 length:432 start_codon:yes stop_codon:yes gene_type:complete
MAIIYTIGFTKKSLEEFINILKTNKITKLVDIRLNRNSQLSGFAKEKDLKYIIEKILGIKYEIVPDFFPTPEILKDYRKDKDWEKYEKKFQELMNKRNGKELIKRLLKGGKIICLLCSESKPNKCHRRLVAELLKGDIEIFHL